MIKLTNESIDVNEVIAAVSNKAAGAVNVFIGTIRDSSLHNKKVVRLEYEAYEPMAISEIQKIIDEATRRWELIAFTVNHRVGVLNPGEVAVAIAVSTKHRQASFEACQYIIDTLKEKVPIFKKEVFEDGSEWISALSEKEKTPRLR